jgi:Flp pilus assembly protein TadG
MIDMQKRFRLAREERGSALVEFAVTVPLLVFLLFAVLDGMFTMYAYHYTAYAAQQGARFAMVRGATASENIPTPCGTSAPPNFTMKFDCTAQSSDIQNYVESLGAINPSNLTVTYTPLGTTPDGVTIPCSGLNSPYSKGCLLRVTASYTFDFLPLVSVTAVTMHATSEKVILE